MTQPLNRGLRRSCSFLRHCGSLWCSGRLPPLLSLCARTRYFAESVAARLCRRLKRTSEFFSDQDPKTRLHYRRTFCQATNNAVEQQYDSATPRRVTSVLFETASKRGLGKPGSTLCRKLLMYGTGEASKCWGNTVIDTQAAGRPPPRSTMTRMGSPRRATGMISSPRNLPPRSDRVL